MESNPNEKKPKKGEYKGIIAIAVVLIVIIAAAVVYYVSQDDGYMTYDEIPSDHPLYGVETPNGTYVYDAEISYQGRTYTAEVEIRIQNDRFTYYAIDGQALSQSDLNELNNQSMQNTRFKITESDTWNNGSRNYDTYLIEFKDRSDTNLIAENGVIVQSTGSQDGMDIEMKLQGWSEGEMDEPEPEPMPESHLVTIYNGGTIVSSSNVTDGSRITEPHVSGQDGYVLVGYTVNGTSDHWDFTKNTVTGDLVLRAHWEWQFSVSVSGDTVTVTPGTYFDDQIFRVDWDDGHSGTYRVSATHTYTEDGNYDLMVVTSDSDGDTWTGYDVVAVNVEEERVTVTFNDDIGRTVLRTVSIGSTVTPPAIQGIREGCVFGGWYDDEGNLWDEDEPVTEDLYLTAEWIQMFSVSWRDSTVTLTIAPYSMFSSSRFSVQWEPDMNYQVSDPGETPTYVFSSTGEHTINVRCTVDGVTYTSYMVVNITNVPTYTVTYYVGDTVYRTLTVNAGETPEYYRPHGTDGNGFYVWRYRGTNLAWGGNVPITEDTEFEASFVHIFDVSVSGTRVTVDIEDRFMSRSIEIDWGDGTVQTFDGVSGNVTHDYRSSFTGTISVTESSPNSGTIKAYDDVSVTG